MARRGDARMPYVPAICHSQSAAFRRRTPPWSENPAASHCPFRALPSTERTSSDTVDYRRGLERLFTERKQFPWNGLQ